MKENQSQKTEKKRPGRKPGVKVKHGGYSIIHRDELLRRNPYIKQYLQDCRDGLIRDVAGSEETLSEQQRIMIDRIISRLSICRLIESYIERFGPFRRDRIKRGKVLELEPALGINYLAFSNSIDRALIALGLQRKVIEPEMSLAEVIKEFDERKRAEKESRESEKSDPEAFGEEISGGKEET